MRAMFMDGLVDGDGSRDRENVYANDSSETRAGITRTRVRISLFAQGLILAIVISAAGCRSTSNPSNATDEDCTSKYGLNRSHEYDDIIERGVLFADIVLSNDVRERVQFTVHHAYWYPR